MKIIAIVACLMFSDVFTMQDCKTYNGEVDEKVINSQRTKFELVIFEKFEGKSPLATIHDTQNELCNPNVMGLVVTKDGILQNLVTMMFSVLVDMYNKHPELLGMVFPLNIIFMDGDELKIECQKGMKMSYNYEYSHSKYRHQIDAIACKQQLTVEEKRFREQVINHSICLFLIQLFLNVNFSSIRCAMIEAEKKWKDAISLIGVPLQASDEIRSYANVYCPSIHGLARIANLAFQNVGRRCAPKSIHESLRSEYETISSLQTVVFGVTPMCVDVRSDFLGISSAIELVNASLIIIRKDISFLYKNVFNIKQERNNADMLKELMLELCIIPCHNPKDDKHVNYSTRLILK